VIDVAIRDRAWTTALPKARALARRAARATLARCAPGAGLVILLTDDAALADLNRRFRSTAGPTNVLSFPAAPNGENHLGDVALALGVCMREAAEQGKALSDHVQHLVVHGALHLMDYDHQTDGEAETMETIERQLLAGLGVSDPYADGGAQAVHVRSGR
jgi:probable rRNA maturation factor